LVVQDRSNIFVHSRILEVNRSVQDRAHYFRSREHLVQDRVDFGEIREHLEGLRGCSPLSARHLWDLSLDILSARPPFYEDVQDRVDNFGSREHLVRSQLAHILILRGCLLLQLDQPAVLRGCPCYSQLDHLRSSAYEDGL